MAEENHQVEAKASPISLDDILKMQDDIGMCSHPDDERNARNDFGDTPLHCIFKRKEYGEKFGFEVHDPDITFTLSMLAIGACPLKRDAKGKMALQLCDREKFPDLHNILASFTLNAALIENDQEAMKLVTELPNNEDVMTKTPSQIIADASKRHPEIWDLNELVLAQFDLKKC